MNAINIFDSNALRPIQKLFLKGIHHTNCIAHHKILGPVPLFILVVEVECNNRRFPIAIANVKYRAHHGGIENDFSDETPVDLVGHDTAYVGIRLVDIREVVKIWEAAKGREKNLF